MIIKQVLTRIYVHDINSAIAFYKGLFHTKCSSRFNYKEVNLELAQVGDTIILCGPEKALEPFRGTQAPFLVDSVTEYRDYLLKHGATIIRDFKKVPTVAKWEALAQAIGPGFSLVGLLGTLATLASVKYNEKYTA